MNETAAFEAGLKMLSEIRKASAKGDEYTKQLLALYDANNPAVLGIPWPKPENK